MIELKGFPYWRNQLKDVPSADKQPAENAAYDCVPEELAACIQYFDGTVIAADELKDRVYGQVHVGGGAELRYSDVLAKPPYNLHLGFDAEASGTTAITNRIRYYLAHGTPCIVTMQSDWNALWGHASFPGLHVGCAWAISETDSGELHIANPWHGFDHVRPVKEWAARLGIGVWPISKIAPAVVTPAGLPGWKDDGQRLVAPNGHYFRGGFREYVIEKAAEGLWGGGEPYGEEFVGPDGVVRQISADALLISDLKSPVREGTMADVCALAAHEHQGKAA